jgi:hypothetical protein
MTAQSLKRLLNVASPALSDDTPRMPSFLADQAGVLSEQLLELYWGRNGFYAFESALHVRPLGVTASTMGLLEWNEPQTWLAAYSSLSNASTFFAEDVFGGQYGVARDGVWKFDPETASFERYSTSIHEWARRILDEPATETGWKLAHDWQTRFGSLKAGDRLVPKVPFVLGGDFNVNNLHALPDVTAMRFYADVANQIRMLPDGSRIRLRVVD